MGHSRVEKAQSRERILAGAAIEIRRNGLDALAIGEVMKSAGLTHGAFYSHFPSRDALVEAAVDRALDAGEARSVAAMGNRAADDVMAMVRSYLSPVHRDMPDSGCAIAALAGEAARSDVARDRVGDRVTRYVEWLATALGDRPGALGKAWSIWSTMTGALTLSRLLSGDASDMVLLSACDAIERIVEPAAP